MEASAGIVRKIGDRAAIVGRSRKPEGRQRSKISNGNKLTAGVDGRSLWVRRLKDLIADMMWRSAAEVLFDATQVTDMRRAQFPRQLAHRLCRP